jgi:hypothetical protein
MAKKKKPAGAVNVSETIRTTWDKDRNAKPAAIVETLKGQGINTNAGTVATTLSAYRKKLGMPALRGKRKGKRAKRATRFTAATSAIHMGVGVDNGRSVSDVIQALKLVTKAKELVGSAGLKELFNAV